jgi:hypothetical protein
MRYRVGLAALLCLSACSSTPKDAGALKLVNRDWDRVNVEVVYTRSADCDDRGPEYDHTDQLIMHKNVTKEFDAPNGESICWRHDRNPNNPSPGVWSGWSRVTLFPGQETETDL